MPTPRRNSVVNDSANFVRARLLALIEGGSLPVDGRLPTERELSEGMDVGRRAVRAALESLLAEGLIWRKQGKGTFAGQPPDKTQLLAAEIVGETSVVDVMEARLCIEPVLAAMAARHALPEDIDRMRNLAHRILQATEPDTIELWDGALHRLIARTAKNKPLLTAFSMIDEIRGNPDWRGVRQKARSMRSLQDRHAEHVEIINRIEAGDGPGAEAAMRRHLTTLADNLKRIFTPDGD
ncbi:FadR/GntR family transcriptional regulator [Tabrizicola sp.]|uniref:FadR/GntR family transcriptional regulator n=1 Tax=Tabrizicola sp. TaxID=2005166 RepID=UPI0035B3A018